MKRYVTLEVVINYFDCSDCIRTSSMNFTDYNENELPILPFRP